MSKQRKRGNSTTSAALSARKAMTIFTGPTCLQGDTLFLSAITDAAKRAVLGMEKSGVNFITGSIEGAEGLMTFQILNGVVRNVTEPSTSGRCGRPSKREGWRRQLKRDLEG
jgi:hypothetical protein